ncbi:hypothetical protein I4U23_026100 [Adineta vaga]|nr:hypothetical protein I4U23_026100 [Adineta vaga]
MIKCIVLICGPPACLKTTLVQILRLILNDQNFNLQYLCVKKLLKTRIKQIKHVFLSFDELFSGYENDIIENESNWKAYRSLIADEIERIIHSKSEKHLSEHLKYSSQISHRLSQSFEYLQSESLLFIEDNFYYSSMRQRYRQIAQRAHIGFLIIHLYSNFSIAYQRNQQRDSFKRVSDFTIENIYSKYELFPEEFLINTTDRGLISEHIQNILQQIEKACREPEQIIDNINDEQRRLATEINQQNFIYQLDQKLRKLISKYLQEDHSKLDKKLYAEMINTRRREFLELIKRKFILLNINDNIEDIFQSFLKEKS